MAADTRNVRVQLEVASAGGDGADALGKLAKKAEEASNKMKGVKKDTQETQVVLRSLGGEIMKIKGPFNEKDIDLIHRMDVGLQRLAKTNLDLAMSVQKTIEAEQKRAAVQAELDKRRPGGQAQGMWGGIKDMWGKAGTLGKAGMVGAAVTGISRILQPISDEWENVERIGHYVGERRTINDPRAQIDPEKGIISGTIGKLYMGVGSLLEKFSVFFGASQTGQKIDNERLEHRFKRYGEWRLDRYADFQSREGIEAPFRERGRQLNEQRYSLRDRYGVDVPFQGVERFQQGERLEKLRRQISMEQAQDPHLDFAWALKGPNDPAQKWRDEILGGRKGTEESERGVAIAERAVNRAAEERVKLEEELERRKKGKLIMTEEEVALNARLAQATDRQIEAEHQLVDAKKAHGAADRERLASAREYAKSQKEMYQGIVSSETQRLKGLGTSYGQSSALDRMKIRSVMEKIANEGFENLTPEERQIGSVHAPDKFRQFGDEIARREGFFDLQRGVGEDRKLKKAGEMEEFFAKIETEIKNQIEVQIKFDEASLSDQLATKVTPLILEAIRRIEIDLARRVLLENELKNAARIAGVGQ